MFTQEWSAVGDWLLSELPWGEKNAKKDACQPRKSSTAGLVSAAAKARLGSPRILRILVYVSHSSAYVEQRYGGMMLERQLRQGRTPESEQTNGFQASVKIGQARSSNSSATWPGWAPDPRH